VSITPVSGTLTAGESFTVVQDNITGITDYSGITATATGFTTSISSIISGGFDDLIVALTASGGTYGPIGSAAGGGVAPAVGAALDAIKAGGDPSFSSIFTALNNLGSISQASEQAGIKQLAPNQIMPQIAAAGLLLDQTVHVMGQHQEGLLAQAGDGSTGRGAGSEYESGVFWAQASGGVATRDSSADSGGYRQSFYGLTFGIDDHIDKDTTLGEAIGWMHSKAGGSGDLTGDLVQLDSIQLTGYGTQRFGQAFVDGMFGIGINLYSERRDITFLTQQASASYHGMQYMGRIEGGWDFPVNDFTLTPLAGFQAVRMNTNAYTESGAGAADIAVGGQGVNSFATTLGGKVATILPTAWGDIAPEIKIAWVHDLANGAIATPAQLDSVSFTTATPRAAKDGAQVTLAATLKQGDNIALRAEYDGDLRSDYPSNSGLVKVDWSF
jgi:outer membrane autotransporter protein